jgi:hypothetical protein
MKEMVVNGNGKNIRNMFLNDLIDSEVIKEFVF